MRIGLVVCFQLVLAATAYAQNSASAPLPDAAKEGGAEGDSRGAIRSLGGVGNGSKQRVEGGVKIPDYVGRVPQAADQLPPGTSPPGTSSNFRPARRPSGRE